MSALSGSWLGGTRYLQFRPGLSLIIGSPMFPISYLYIYIYTHGGAILHPRCYTLGVEYILHHKPNLSRKNTEQY